MAFPLESERSINGLFSFECSLPKSNARSLPGNRRKRERRIERSFSTRLGDEKIEVMYGWLFCSSRDSHSFHSSLTRTLFSVGRIFSSTSS